MTFFEPIEVAAPEFAEEGRPLPWDDGLGRTVFTDVNLAHGSDGAILLRNLIAFPTVMTLAVVALFRRPLVHGPGTRGNNHPTFSEPMGVGSVGTGVVLFGLRFNDGTTFRNLDDKSSQGRLRGLGGGGRAFTGFYDFWAPLPPSGDMEIWVAWPAAGISETRTLLDGTRVTDAASALAAPWT